ncbi:smg-4/UPF3 family domain-containing protein [Phthorimaea operculella]|nr:smg-4/UPF3 family domain-containing protein [Phthorimaea operculella]
MTEDQDAKDSHSDSGGKTYAKGKDKKAKAQRPLTKIILRRLPPTMTEEQFLEQVSPIPEHDYFYFAKPDPSLANNLYSRAYINFINVEDIYLFRDKFDGYIFLDEKGVEYMGIVEYAPFQRIPKKKKKKDPKCGTIESDPIYQEFYESLTKEPEPENQPKLEYSYPISDGNDKKVQSTPLLEYLAARKLDKRGRDERRRRENDKRKMRIERKGKDISIKAKEGGENEVKKIKSREWEKDKYNDTKDDKDGIVFESKTYRDRKSSSNVLSDKKKKVDGDKKESIHKDEEFDDRKRDKYKDTPRESKSKKYSDTRKERVNKTDSVSQKQSMVSKMISSESKTKSLNHDDIKPFTQLPQVKTDDLTKLIEGMEKKTKLEESQAETKSSKDVKDSEESDRKSDSVAIAKVRKSSVDSGEASSKEETEYRRRKSTEERSKSTDREGSEEKDKESAERRAERRIRNKDRPSLVIYQPGMGKFSKQRIGKDKEPTAKSINDSEKKDT